MPTLATNRPAKFNYKILEKYEAGLVLAGHEVKAAKKAHQFAEKHRINILGGTHYSTEKFACISMVDYFKKLGLPSKFIKDKPVMEDM